MVHPAANLILRMWPDCCSFVVPGLVGPWFVCEIFGGRQPIDGRASANSPRSWRLLLLLLALERARLVTFFGAGVGGFGRLMCLPRVVHAAYLFPTRGNSAQGAGPTFAPEFGQALIWVLLLHPSPAAAPPG